MWSLMSFMINMVGRIGGGNSKNFSACIAGFINGVGGLGDLSQIWTNLGAVDDCGKWAWSIMANLANPISYENNSPTSALAFVTSSPISSTAYFRDIGQRLNIIPEANAQTTGFGFQAASSVLELWKISRNIAYILIIFVMIIMAFMIMFRVKLSPQVVISVQSALPKVFITLILITFSYAIAGFMIDLMYVVIGLLAAILTSGANPISVQDWSTTFGELTYTNGIISLFVKYLGIFFLTSLWTFISTPWLLAALIPFFVWIIVFVLVFVVLLILMVRVIWMMVKNFVMLLIYIMFGPFMILGGALGFGGFGAWLKKLAALLAVYPIVGFLFVLSFIFLQAVGAWSDGMDPDLLPFDIAPNVIDGTWGPPFMGSGGDLDMLWLFASLAIIAMIPKIPDAINAAMEKTGFNYGTAIGEAGAPVVGSVTGAGRSAAYGTAYGARRYGAEKVTKLANSENIGRIARGARRIGVGSGGAADSILKGWKR